MQSCCLIDEEAHDVGDPEPALSRILQSPFGRDPREQTWGMTMPTLVQAAVRRTEQVSGFGVIVLFSLFGLVFSVIVARCGFDITCLG